MQRKHAMATRKQERPPLDPPVSMLSRNLTSTSRKGENPTLKQGGRGGACALRLSLRPRLLSEASLKIFRQQ